MVHPLGYIKLNDVKRIPEKTSLPRAKNTRNVENQWFPEENYIVNLQMLDFPHHEYVVDPRGIENKISRHGMSWSMLRHVFPLKHVGPFWSTMLKLIPYSYLVSKLRNQRSLHIYFSYYIPTSTEMLPMENTTRPSTKTMWLDVKSLYQNMWSRVPEMGSWNDHF